jgi:hypothetical protein
MIFEWQGMLRHRLSKGAVCPVWDDAVTSTPTLITLARVSCFSHSKLMAQDVVRQADRTCLGVIQEAQYQAREKHTQRAKPQPWIVLKLAVFISVAIIGFTSWVYSTHIDHFICIVHLTSRPSCSREVLCTHDFKARWGVREPGHRQ